MSMKGFRAVVRLMTTDFEWMLLGVVVVAITLTAFALVCIGNATGAAAALFCGAAGSLVTAVINEMAKWDD